MYYENGPNIEKKIFPIEQVNAIIEKKTPVKYKDPRCLNISVIIEETHIEKALLDWGASVNILPY